MPNTFHPPTPEISADVIFANDVSVDQIFADEIIANQNFTDEIFGCAPSSFSIFTATVVAAGTLSQPPLQRRAQRSGSASLNGRGGGRRLGRHGRVGVIPVECWRA